jgi:hypothetical protein
VQPPLCTGQLVVWLLENSACPELPTGTAVRWAEHRIEESIGKSWASSSPTIFKVNEVLESLRQYFRQLS